MNRSNLIVFFLTFFLLGESIQDDETQKVIEGLTKFPFKLNKLLYKSNENLVYSPFNVYSILSKLHLAASGESRDQIRDLLEIPKNIQATKVSHALQKLIKTAQDSSVYKSVETSPGVFEKKKTFQINIADGSFVQEGVSLKTSFEKYLKTYYGDKIISLDFVKNGEQSVDIMNKYIADKTENNIPKLFTRKLSPNTRVVMTGCLYFKGMWNKIFNSEATKNDIFYRQNGNITVKMMRKTEKMYYSEIPSLKAKSIRLDFANPSVKMGIVLPEEGQSLDEVLKNFSSDNLQQILSESNEYVDVRLKLPKTTFSWSGEMKEYMENLGVKKIFSNTAELNNMITSNDLKVDGIIHSTIMKIDESGTEAASATAAVMGKKSFHFAKKTVDFEVNRPFLVVIYHFKMESMLFFGAVNNPGSV